MLKYKYSSYYGLDLNGLSKAHILKALSLVYGNFEVGESPGVNH